MSDRVARRERLSSLRMIESVLYLLSGVWIGWLLTDGEWLAAVLLAIPMLTLIFAPRRVG